MSFCTLEHFEELCLITCDIFLFIIIIFFFWGGGGWSPTNDFHDKDFRIKLSPKFYPCLTNPLILKSRGGGGGGGEGRIKASNKAHLTPALKLKHFLNTGHDVTWLTLFLSWSSILSRTLLPLTQISFWLLIQSEVHCSLSSFCCFHSQIVHYCCYWSPFPAAFPV